MACRPVFCQKPASKHAMPTAIAAFAGDYEAMRAGQVKGRVRKFRHRPFGFIAAGRIRGRRKLAVRIVMNWRRFLGAMLTGVGQPGYGIASLGAAAVAAPSLARLGARPRRLLVRAGPGRLAGLRSAVCGDLLR
jgi:hypothetical protein